MTTPIRVGTPVPDFTMNAFDPVAGDFTKVSLAKQKE